MESRTYDVQDLVASIELQDGNGVLYTIEYVRDIVGNILSIDDSRGTLTEFEYDAELQLVKETITTGAGSRVIQYVYDAFGNRVQKIDSSAGTTTYTYDANDRLLESSGSETISYAYDANGNLISETSSGGTLTTYQWNARDELTGVNIEENGATTEIEYQYDLAGNRVSISVDGNQVNYLVDVTRELPVVLAEYSEVGITREFIYSDRIISSDTGSGDLTFYHGDHINSVIAQTDTSSTLVSQIGRDSFGNVLSLTGLESDFGLAGEPVDATSGLTYLRARNLDTQTGRFISTDPFDGARNNPASLHRYLYAENNPLVNVDPTGEYTLTQVVVGLGVGGTLLAISQQVIGNLIARTTGKVNWAGSSIAVSADAGDFTVGGTGLAIPIGVQLNRMGDFQRATFNGKWAIL